MPRLFRACAFSLTCQLITYLLTIAIFRIQMKCSLRLRNLIVVENTCHWWAPKICTKAIMTTHKTSCWTLKTSRRIVETVGRSVYRINNMIFSSRSTKCRVIALSTSFCAISLLPLSCFQCEFVKTKPNARKNNLTVSIVWMCAAAVRTDTINGTRKQQEPGERGNLF